MNGRAPSARIVGLIVLAAAVWLAAPAPVGAEVDLLLVDRVEARIAAGDDTAFATLEQAIQAGEATPDEQIDLLAELARLRLAHGDYADAGEAFAYQADLIARREKALAPELAGIYAAAADAYARAGDAATALPLAGEALDLDSAYLDCASAVVAGDHARLADLHAALGDAGKAADERRLAGDAAARCAAAGDRSRGVVVTSEFATASEDSFARVKVFYATDRARTGSDRPNDFYGGDRGTLDYGTLEVTVPRNHKPGAVESPSLIKLEWSENPERHYVLTRIETMTGEAMFADMRATLAERGADEAFVFVHGFNVTFTEAAKRTAQIAYDLNFAGAPILYSWPSRGSAFAYVSDEAVVRLSGRRLLGFLRDVAARSGARRINLIAHSMGNRAMIDALELLAAYRAGAGDSDPLFEQAIFAAPDEDAGLFAEMMETIRPVARRLTLYGSENDVALSASRRLHGDQARAGQGGDAILVSGALDTIDMSVLGDDMLGHGYFSSSASALTDMLWLFWHDAPPDDRCGMDARTGDRGRFWLFDPARCDGPVMLSALTLLKAQGAAALDKLDAILARVTGGGKRGEIEEWQAIRRAMLASIGAR